MTVVGLRSLCGTGPRPCYLVVEMCGNYSYLVVVTSAGSPCPSPRPSDPGPWLAESSGSPGDASSSQTPHSGRPESLHPVHLL